MPIDVSVSISRIANMSTDIRKVGYASIAVIDLQDSGMVAIETISVTRDACDLSGAWLLKSFEKEKIQNLLSDKILVLLGTSKDSEKKLTEIAKNQVFVSDFLNEAKAEAAEAMRLYEDFKATNEKDYAEYMSIKPAERKLLPKVTKKNLTEPTFSKWPSKLDLSESESEMANLGKLSQIDGTPAEMRKVLAASRLIQMLVYMWKLDETERVSRQYVKDEIAAETILPVAWLNQINR